MKKLIIAVSLLTTMYSCHPSGGSSVTPSNDTTFTGSYFQYSYSGNYTNSKAFNLGAVSTYPTLAVLINATSTIGVIGGSTIPLYTIGLVNNYGLYGSNNCSLVFLYNGSGTGSYPMSSPSNGGAGSSFLTASGQMYNDTTGTVTITHQGTDYVQGTFTGTMYSLTGGLSQAVSGSFKVIH